MSVGHLARLLEEAGIATVIIAVASFRDVLAAMNTPRILITKHPMGRPIGQPNDKDGQLDVVKAALDLFSETRAFGTLKEYAGTYSRKI